jgi:hypothetical protein
MRCQGDGSDLVGLLSVTVGRTMAVVIAWGVLRLVGLDPMPDATYVEIAVLGHQLRALRRQGRPTASAEPDGVRALRHGRDQRRLGLG